MHKQLEFDKADLNTILSHTLEASQAFLDSLPERKVAVQPVVTEGLKLPFAGLGALQALELFQSRYSDRLSASAGARYFGFVTGGATPAALSGDWLTSVIDNNATGYGDSVVPLIELETLAMLRDLFGIPDSFTGAFVTGATMSNFTGLAIARQWYGQKQGINIAQEGLQKPIKILAATAHSSVYKALSMLGMGRNSLLKVECLENREAINVAVLERALSLSAEPCIVVASAGTVNTVDYDDIAAIADLKERYDFYLHVDAAFGGFAAVSEKTKHLLAGWQAADSITIDAHKWLNVPYDSAMIFTKHDNLQVEVFQNAAVYLGQPSTEPNFVHRTPENSRRFRALAAWMTLQAYGKEGYKAMVEQASDLARSLAKKIAAHPQFKLLAPASMNGICFTLEAASSQEDINTYLNKLKEDGRVFLTPTFVFDTPAIRVSITNWQTTQDDIDSAWLAMQEVL